ncbi:hypothetical protein PM082_006170 [Marasmius tenuissimus]|nr:hypothetical protein PM082_006170 [Marasmius tenuissimus]
MNRDIDGGRNSPWHISPSSLDEQYALQLLSRPIRAVGVLAEMSMLDKSSTGGEDRIDAKGRGKNIVIETNTNVRHLQQPAHVVQCTKLHTLRVDYLPSVIHFTCRSLQIRLLQPIRLESRPPLELSY